MTAVCPGPVDTEFFKISGELPGALKTTFRADVQKVVRTALQDAVSGKAVSVYGMPMKADFSADCCRMPVLPCL